MTNVIYIRTAYKIVKYYPLFVCILSTIHSFLLLNDYDFVLLRIMCRMPIIFAFILTELSVSFGFCKLHRIMIYYSFASNVRYLMFKHNLFNEIGVNVDVFRFIMFLMGLFIIILFVIKKYGRRETCTCSSCKANRGISRE